MGVVEDKGCRKDKAFLILWHLLCVEWGAFFVTMRGYTTRGRRGSALFFNEKTASMSCSFMIDASGGSRLGFFPML